MRLERKWRNSGVKTNKKYQAINPSPINSKQDIFKNKEILTLVHINKTMKEIKIKTLQSTPNKGKIIFKK